MGDEFDIVIHHGNCYDGLTAAWVASMGSPNATFVPAAYGDAPPDVEGKRVLVVDFSYPRGTLIEMHQKARRLLVLDHHKTAAEDLAGLDFAVFDMDRSGAGLAWDELEGGPRPDIVAHVEDRDLWRFKYSETKRYHAAMSCYPMTFEAWDEISETPLAAMLATGESVLRYHENTCRKLAERAGVTRLGDVAVWHVNVPVEFVSETAEQLKGRDPHRPVLGWSYDSERGTWYCSLRSRDDGPDVSEIARQFGGGGHKHAAGFRSSRPFWLDQGEGGDSP